TQEIGTWGKTVSAESHSNSQATDSRYVVVSCDAHVGPSLRHQLREYCEQRYLADYDAFVDEFEARQAATLSGQESVREITQFFPQERFAITSTAEGLQDPGAHVRDMDADGVAANIIFPGGQN